MNIRVRYARRDELERVNELREMVNEVHVNGRLSSAQGNRIHHHPLCGSHGYQGIIAHYL